MSRLLASVNCLEEALFIQAYGIDIIDLKQPAQGALGALPLADITEIVARLDSEQTVSATIGDLPMLPETVFAASVAVANTGVDFVKIGFFPGGDWQACLDRLRDLSDQGVALIAVMFADCQPDFSWITALQRAGFAGAMLDTMDKSRGSLTDIMTAERLQAFVGLAKQANLLTGLAGSLSAADVPLLQSLAADYLGFRGGLCQQHRRTASLDPAKIAAIRKLMDFSNAISEFELV